MRSAWIELLNRRPDEMQLADPTVYMCEAFPREKGNLNLKGKLNQLEMMARNQFHFGAWAPETGFVKT